MKGSNSPLPRCTTDDGTQKGRPSVRASRTSSLYAIEGVSILPPFEISLLYEPLLQSEAAAVSSSFRMGGKASQMREMLVV